MRRLLVSPRHGIPNSHVKLTPSCIHALSELRWLLAYHTINRVAVDNFEGERIGVITALFAAIPPDSRLPHKFQVRARMHMISVFTLLMALFIGLASCQAAGGPSGGTSQVVSGRSPDAAVSGTITYRERIALSEDATVIVELRDVSLADAAAPLIASQTIRNPGQVPIEFRVLYNRDDIDSRNTYGITARILGADGRLAFINDTAHDVITRGNPTRVDMVLVLVQPPMEMLEEDPDIDWRTWLEAPVRANSANLMRGEPEHLLRVVYPQSMIEGCARPGNKSLQVNGYDVDVSLTLMRPPDTPWAIDCGEQTVELDEIFHIASPFKTGKTYRVTVNGQVISTFTLPDPKLGHTFTAPSIVRSVEVVEAGDAPYTPAIRIVSGRPSGSCTQYNGYELRVSGEDRLDISVTHHQVADPEARCTKDFPADETLVPLILDPESEYTVVVNGDTSVTIDTR